MIEKTYNVGIYCRLSNDDERDGESVSIENQKLLLQNYVRQRGWNEIDTYIDDGYSGTNFDRPGVKRLIEDAKAKRINVILVKDLSRFGRNYIEFGQYTDYLFPSLGCRFIALNNGIDTESTNGSTDVMCFLNLFNEFYSRDTSKKVKAVKKACAENGKFMGTYPAYGYRRDPADKHHLVIDEETAPIVRRIFEMRAAGAGFHAIAVVLNEDGIPSPGVLYYQRKGQSDPRQVNHKWAEQTIKRIIRNEVYIGNMVQGKTGTMSYKSRKLIGKPEEEWIRVDGTHEPIISQELWDTVVSIDKKKVRKSPTTDGCKSIFTGLVYCADCGFKMRNQVEKFTYKDGTPGRYSSFICGNYSRSGKGACTVHNLFSDVDKEFSLFDPKFLEEISRMKEKNLAIELLKKLIAEQVSVYKRTNVVKSEKFSEIIQGAMNRYLNGMLTNEQVIEELLKLARDIANAHAEGEKMGLTEEEMAFYDALTKPQAIKDFYEHDELIAITRELTDTLRKNRTIDWQKKESARAGMRRLVKRLLKKHKYPPEGMADAVQTVMSQCEMWTDTLSPGSETFNPREPTIATFINESLQSRNKIVAGVISDSLRSRYREILADHVLWAVLRTCFFR